jgi:hypothetical protein
MQIRLLQCTGKQSIKNLQVTGADYLQLKLQSRTVNAFERFPEIKTAITKGTGIIKKIEGATEDS